MIRFLKSAFPLIAGWFPILCAAQLQWTSIENNGRNSFLPAKNLPDKLSEENILWRRDMQAKWHFARPTVTGDRIILGTHISAVSDQAIRESCTRKAVAVICLDAGTGEIIWELGIADGAPTGYGICASPTVEGDRVYIAGPQSIYCLDLNGQADGNDGPFEDEIKLMLKTNWKGEVQGKEINELKPEYGDVIWRRNLKELGVSPHDASSGSVLIDGDLLWVSTSHAYGKKPAPARMDKPEDAKKYKHHKAPNVLVLDKKTGEVLAQDDMDIERIFHGQWCSFSKGELDGRDLFFWGDGFGILHAFERPRISRDGKIQIMEPVWSLDCNPKDYRYDAEGREIGFPTHGKNERPKKAIGPCHIIGTPVFHDKLLYLAIGRDRAYSGKSHTPGEGNGRILCIDPSKPEILWDNRDLGRTQSTLSIWNGLIYVADMSRYMHCFDQLTGEKIWDYDLKQLVECQSQLLADNKLYVSNRKGEFFILQAGNEAKLLSECRPGGHIATPTAVDGILYLCTQKDVTAYKGTTEP